MASTAVLYPLLAGTTIAYVHGAITRPAGDVYPLGMAAFGVTAALSGVCFAMAPVDKSAAPILYAGEKFLHASLLLVQTLLALYMKDSLAAAAWIEKLPTIGAIISAGLGAAILLIATAAAWSWNWGFEEANKYLWQRWRDRVGDADQNLVKPEPTQSRRATNGLLAVALRQFFNFIGYAGVLFILYGVISAGTGSVWPPLEKWVTPMSASLTIVGTILIAGSIYFYTPAVHPPERFSRYISAPSTIISGVLAIVFLLLYGSLPPVVVNGFAMLGIAGGFFRIKQRPAEP